jgi:hypothetical protein
MDPWWTKTIQVIASAVVWVVEELGGKRKR